MERFFTIAGSLLMFLAVGAGAFGAHGLKAYFGQHPDLAATFETAVRYHLIHALALLFVAVATTKWPGTAVNTSGYLILVGIFIFSGSLYLLAFTGIRWLGAITPIGGVAFLVGWLLLAWVAWRG